MLFPFSIAGYFYSDGKIQVNSDKSVILEGHIFVLNAIHSFLLNKTSNLEQTINKNPSESITFSTENINIKICNGKLFEQNVDSVMYVSIVLILIIFHCLSIGFL